MRNSLRFQARYGNLEKLKAFLLQQLNLRRVFQPGVMNSHLLFESKRAILQEFIDTRY